MRRISAGLEGIAGTDEVEMEGTVGAAVGWKDERREDTSEVVKEEGESEGAEPDNVAIRSPEANVSSPAFATVAGGNDSQPGVSRVAKQRSVLT